ncbi:hypothetical protein [Streptomyces sp. NPDC088910]|uniref:hypothetical protein n=1 Tax=Streptomyces sp. NPDC088910 TaxID=3365911 RepID=UPI0038024A13
MSSSPAQPVVDVDDPTTWPAPFADVVRRLADDAHLDDVTLSVDLDLYDEEDQARRLLSGCLVRARHCTRLLDYEDDAVRAQGLRLLTVDLVNERLDQAYERGLFTAEEHTLIREKNCLTPQPSRWGRRADQVCFTLSEAAMVHNVDSGERLLTFWGGEAIYWLYCETHPEIGRKLRTMGRPTIVTALLDLSDPGKHRIYKSLINTFVGKALGNEEVDADVLYFEPVPPERIESVVHPGDPKYDRFPALRRT